MADVARGFVAPRAGLRDVAFVGGELEAAAVGGAAAAEGFEGLFADADAVAVGDQAGGAEVVEVVVLDAGRGVRLPASS